MVRTGDEGCLRQPLLASDTTAAKAAGGGACPEIKAALAARRELLPALRQDADAGSIHAFAMPRLGATPAEVMLTRDAPVPNDRKGAAAGSGAQAASPADTTSAPLRHPVTAPVAVPSRFGPTRPGGATPLKSVPEVGPGTAPSSIPEVTIIVPQTNGAPFDKAHANKADSCGRKPAAAFPAPSACPLTARGVNAAWVALRPAMLCWLATSLLAAGVWAPFGVRAPYGLYTAFVHLGTAAGMLCATLYLGCDCPAARTPMHRESMLLTFMVAGFFAFASDLLAMVTVFAIAVFRCTALMESASAANCGSGSAWSRANADALALGACLTAHAVLSLWVALLARRVMRMLNPLFSVYL